MNSKDEYYCPRCKSKNLLVYDEIIECPQCQLTFTKKFLKELQDDSILAEEEKADFIHIFKKKQV
jgi:transposase-like protein